MLGASLSAAEFSFTPPPSHGSFPPLCCFVFPQGFDAPTSSLPFFCFFHLPFLSFSFIASCTSSCAFSSQGLPTCYAPWSHRLCLLLMHLGFANNSMVPYYGSTIPFLPCLSFNIDSPFMIWRSHYMISNHSSKHHLHYFLRLLAPGFWRPLCIAVVLVALKPSAQHLFAL